VPRVAPAFIAPCHRYLCNSGRGHKLITFAPAAIDAPGIAIASVKTGGTAIAVLGIGSLIRRKFGMADEEDDSEEGEEAADPAAAGKKKKLMLLGGVVAALLLVSGIGTWALLHFLSDKPAEVATEPGTEAKGEEKPAEPVKPSKEPALYVQLDPTFLANYTVNGRQHYLQLSVAVLTREEAMVDAMRTHMPLIRNRLVMLLSGEAFEKLQTDEGRLLLQQKLLTAIQEILQKETGKAGIEQVLFTGFVMT
jgi:flagellar FliL protein